MSTDISTPEKKTRKRYGLPGIGNNNGRLVIRGTYQNKAYCLSCGIPYERKHFKLAERIIAEMEKDILYSEFDVSLERYRKLTPKGGRAKPEVKRNLELDALWDLYTEFKTTHLEVTTINLGFKRVKFWINKLPSRNIVDSIQIKDYLVQNATVGTCKYVLMQLSSACKWGIDNALCDRNPFKGSGTDIRQKGGKKTIDPFSKDEMNCIIQAFEQDKKHLLQANFIKFLFWTGCRPSEAVGLRWADINKQCNKITFQQAAVRHGGRITVKGLKTQSRRSFPCGKQLIGLLSKMKGDNKSNNEYVFTQDNGELINLETLYTQHWKGKRSKDRDKQGIIDRLIQEGAVERYRPMYNTRHTFITLMLQQGIDVATVASWVGNSPQIIYKHYSGINKGMVPVDL